MSSLHPLFGNYVKSHVHTGSWGSGKLCLGRRSTSPKDAALFDPRLSDVIEMAPSSPMVMKMDSLRYNKLWFSKQKSKIVFGYVIMVLKKPMNSSNNHLPNHFIPFQFFHKNHQFFNAFQR